MNVKEKLNQKMLNRLFFQSKYFQSIFFNPFDHETNKHHLPHSAVLKDYLFCKQSNLRPDSTTDNFIGDLTQQMCFGKIDKCEITSEMDKK